MVRVSLLIQTLADKLRAVRPRLREEVGIVIFVVGEGQLIGSELVQETTKKISQIKDILKAARNRHKKEPVKILDREFKRLKRSRIAIVKVRWNSKRGLEFMWEHEDQMKLKYPHLFSDISYRIDGDDFCENYVKFRFNVINNPFWKENIRNVIVNGNWVGCSYKEFLACNPKEYDGMGGAVVLTHWIEKNGICTLSREVAVSMSWNDFKFMMIQEFCPSHEMQKLESELWNHAMIAGALLMKAVRNRAIMKDEKKETGGTYKDKNGRDDNKRTRTGNVFATTVNPVGRENTGENKNGREKIGISHLRKDSHSAFAVGDLDA
ncbi:hypothetical protein Tco_0772022 [Tanacetum coccineum]|uniref:Uncharacterized protein n=1 Tax=Tanacetum coccineum TaxID=301880 RepID=A0ABQ4ZJA7_9ASTR